MFVFTISMSVSVLSAPEQTAVKERQMRLEDELTSL